MGRQPGTRQLIVPRSGQTAGLTTRQIEVLGLAAQGLTGKQIGRYLGISVRTVEAHFSGMRQRTGARSDGELIVYAITAGLLAPGLPPPPHPAGRRKSLTRKAGKPGLPPGVENRSFSDTPRNGRQDSDSHRMLHEKGVEKSACPLMQPGPVLIQSPAMTVPSPRSAFSGDHAPKTDAPPGALVGYVRISTTRQNLDRQIRAVKDAGCIRVFVDRQSGKTAARVELDACLDYLRPGDTLVVPSLDRLSRSLQDLITLVAGLCCRELGFRSLHEALDTTTPGGRLVFHVFAALAEFIRELIVQGTHEGIQAARARGVRLGRPPAMTPEQIRHARALLAHPDNTVSSIARLLGVSRSTIYKHVPELAGPRGSAWTSTSGSLDRGRAVTAPAPAGWRRPGQ
jgi:DNA invertase Pin-like site-specific DNA recombinase